MHLRRQNRPQVKEECTGIFARETKRWHIRMVSHQALAQAVHESIEIHSTIERAEGRSTNVRTLTALADRMTLRAALSSAKPADVASNRQMIASLAITFDLFISSENIFAREQH